MNNFYIQIPVSGIADRSGFATEQKRHIQESLCLAYHASQAGVRALPACGIDDFVGVHIQCRAVLLGIADIKTNVDDDGLFYRSLLLSLVFVMHLHYQLRGVITEGSPRSY